MQDLGEIVGIILANPQLAIVLLVQFLLGLTLGYFAVKALKYVLAFIAILALGSVLSVWSIGLTPEEALKTLGLAVGALKGLATLLGLTTIGPTVAGFIVGAVVAIARK